MHSKSALLGTDRQSSIPNSALVSISQPLVLLLLVFLAVSESFAVVESKIISVGVFLRFGVGVFPSLFVTQRGRRALG